MSTPTLGASELQEAVNLVALEGTVSAAARKAGIVRPTFSHRYERAIQLGYKPTVHVENAEAVLRAQVRALEAELAAHGRETLNEDYVRNVIVKLAASKPERPDWLIKPARHMRDVGVPTLSLSDTHWGEVVDPAQVGGVNEFNLEIAHRRMFHVVEHAVDLCKNHVTNKGYPGIVLQLIGDMVTGDIHEELTATNEKEIMPCVVDLWGVLVKVIEILRDEFGRVFVPCVTGNHGRITHKMRAKGRAFTSFDWLIYTFLAKHFESDKRVTFQIPDGSDAHYRVYNHRYLLTHGDQFRGGDGMIGALGPIIRGDHRKRSRNAQIDQSYDTMCLGHWHQLIQLQRLIVNGSLKGYDEYAYQGNFPFEMPRQALWITHPDYGITFSMPVFAERAPHDKARKDWVSI